MYEVMYLWEHEEVQSYLIGKTKINTDGVVEESTYQV